MNALNKCLVILELFFLQLLPGEPYTVVLKQVKPLPPSVKVYRYDLRYPKAFPESSAQYIYHRPLPGQRIYPVATRPGREGNYKTRVPAKKEKGQLYKYSLTENPTLRDPRLLGLSQSLVPPISNQLEEYSEAREDENDVRPLPASFQSGKSFSTFRQEKGRIYNNPGDWATPAPQANSENTTTAEFTPSQLYLQIRHKNTVIHVPQSEALKDAETLEELINAPRLKELSRTTHVQETYSEEGYEDAGYDHAGHVRQAQHGEVYNAKDEGRFKIKERPIILDYDSDLGESKEIPLNESNAKKVVSPAEDKLKPAITPSRSEMSKTLTEYSKTPKNYKGMHKYSSKVKSSGIVTHKDNNFNATNSKEFSSIEATFPSYFEEVLPSPETSFAKDSLMPNKSLSKKSSKYKKNDLNSTKIYPVLQLASANSPSQINGYTDFDPYISIIDSQASPSAKTLKYSRIYSKKTKQLRLEPYKNENIYSPPPSPPPPPPSPISLELLPQDVPPPLRLKDQTKEEELANQRIVLPTIGYINSLTTAHFGKGNSKPSQDESKPELTDAFNLTQALSYLRTNKNQQNLETTKLSTEYDVRTFEPMKLKSLRSDPESSVNKMKRDIQVMGTNEKRPIEKAEEEYEGNDESDLPHDEKNDEIAEDERRRIEEEKREKEKFEEELKQEISGQEKEITKETLKNIGVEKDISEVFPESSFSDPELDFIPFSAETTPTPIDIKKYPFYTSKKLPENSALRYATDPRQFPKKSGHKMEFYESRERLIQCPDFHPDLSDLPNSNLTELSSERAEESPRRSRLGDKILCLRMKYFDPEPFDNPIFKEKEIEYVGKKTRNQKNVRIQVTPKLDKNEKNLLQTPHHKFFAAKQKDQKPNEEFNANASNSQSLFSRHRLYKTLKPLPTGQPMMSINTSPTKKNRVIPVTEVLDDFPSNSATATQSKAHSNVVVGWKTIYHSQDRTRKPTDTKNQIFEPQNCLPHISKMTVLDGAKNLTINCKDVILIQEILNNAARLKIAPKEKNKELKVVKNKLNKKIPALQSSDRTDWTPIVGYRLPKHQSKSSQPLSRRTDEVGKLKKETIRSNNSAHYVIDELKEDENVRKGEVVEDMNHYLKLMENLEDEMTETTTIKEESKTENSTRKRRETQNNQEKPNKQNNFAKRLEFSFDKSRQIQTSTENSRAGVNFETSKPFETKRPLKRLSGIDFLIRYHKNKHKPTAQKAEDFWKVAQVTEKNIQKLSRTIFKNKREKVDQTTSFQSTGETTTKKHDIKETIEFRKHQANTSAERQTKPKVKQTNGIRKISPLNLIPEKVTKRPEGRPSEFWKASAQSVVLEKAAIKPPNFTKIITKVSRNSSESSEKARVIYKPGTSHSVQNSTAETPASSSTSSAKAETLQQKTLDRSSTYSKNDSEYWNASAENPEGPILYYVINLKTGRGKWIKNYNEPSRGSSGKYRKLQKPKESSGTRREKTLRRKKLKY